MVSHEVDEQILSCLETLKEAVNELYSSLESGNICKYLILHNEMKEFLFSIKEISDKNNFKNKAIHLSDAVESTVDSLNRIKRLSKINISLALQKIEFELYPFVLTMYAEFYFWTEIFPYREKWEDYYTKELPELYSNQYINEAVVAGNYKYDLSVLIVGYNKLEYTKLCVQSVLDNLPEGVTCELILLNH